MAFEIVPDEPKEGLTITPDKAGFQIVPDADETPSGVLSTIAGTGRAAAAGMVGGVESYLKETALGPRILGKPSPFLESTVGAVERFREYAGPKKPGIWEQGVQSTFQSLTGMAPGLLAKGKGVRGKFLRGAVAKGQAFGAAETYDFLNEVRSQAIINGASEDEVREVESQNLPKALLSGSLEVAGEIGSDIISGYIFGILKNPSISEPVKTGIKSWLKDYVVRTGKALGPEIAGELGTETGQYYLRESAGLAEGGPALAETAATTAIQTALMGLLGTAAGRAQLRQRDKLAANISEKTGVPEEIVKREITAAEQLGAAYTSGKDKLESGIESLQKKRDEGKEGRKKKPKPTPPSMPEEAREEMIADAESLREHERQLYEGGPEQGQGPREGGEDIQREQEQRVEGIQPEAEQQAGRGRETQREEEVVAPTELIPSEEKEPPKPLPIASQATPVQQAEEAPPLTEEKVVQIPNKPVDFIPPEQYETFELSKGYGLRKLAEKIVLGNAASRRAAIKKAQTAIDKGIVTPNALSDVAGNFFSTIDMEDAQRLMKEGKLDDAGAISRIEKTQKLLQEFSEKIGVQLAGKGAAEPTMQEQVPSPKEKVKRINEAVADVKKQKVLYKEIKDRLYEGDKIEDIVAYHRADLETFFLDEEQMPKVIEAIGLKEKILSPIDILLGRQVDRDIESGKLYDKLVDEGKTDEEIEAVLQEKYGTSPGTVEVGIQDTGSDVLQELDEELKDIPAEAAPQPEVVKPETKRQKIVKKIKAKAKVEKPPEIAPTPPAAQPVKPIKKGLSAHPMYMSPEEAATQAGLLQGRVKPDSPLEVRIRALQAHINNAYHTGGDIEIIADQLVRVIGQLETQKNRSYGDRQMSAMQIEDSLKELGGLASLIGQMQKKEERAMAYQQVVSPREAKEALDELANIIRANIAIGRQTTAADILPMLMLDPVYSRLLSETYGPTLQTKFSEIPIKLRAAGYSAGAYNSENNIIFINPKSVYTANINTRHTLAHEVIHAVTARELDSNPNFWAYVEALMNETENNLSNEYKKIVTLMRAFSFEDIMQGALNNNQVQFEDQSTIYAFTDPHEFLSVAFSDKRFKELLENMKGIDNRSLWRKFVDGIKQYVLGMDITQPSLFDQAFEAVVGYGGTYEGPTAGEQQAPKPIFQYLQNFAQRTRDREHRTNRTIFALEHAPLKGSGIHAGIVGGEGAINIKPRIPDAPLLSTLFWGPMNVAEKYGALADNPIPAKTVAGVIHATDLSRYETANGLLEIQKIKEGLKKAERQELSSDMKEIEMGETIKMKPKLQEKAQRIKELFNSIREKYKESRRTLFFESLNTGEQEILKNVFDGQDASEATFEYNKKARAFNRTQKAADSKERIPVTSYQVIQSHMEYLKDLEKWGWQDYITHAMKGSITLTDEKGKIISVAQTTRQAIERAKDYVNEHPSTNQINIEYDHWLEKDSPVKLSKKQAQYLQGIVAKAINKEVKEIQEGVNVHIAKRALGKVVSIKPGYVFAPYTQEREDVLPGEEDIFDILPAYVYQMNKKIALDPVIQYWTNNRHKVEQTNLRNMIDKQIEAAKGKYWFEDRVVDDALRWLGTKASEMAEKAGIEYHPEWGEKGFAASRAMSKLTSTEAQLKFGYRPMAGLLNRMSGFGHTWVKTGLPYMIRARQFLKTEQGQEFLQNHAADLGTALVEEAEGKIKMKVRKISPTYLFQAAEKPNREESYVASYLWATDKLEMGAEEAREFARRSVWLQQFNYNIAAIPEIFRSPVGRGIFQFKTYLMNELSFIANLKGPKEWSKYLAMQFVLGGPKGFLMTLKSLPVVGALAGIVQAIRGGDDWFEELEQYANTKIPRLFRGAWGFFGIDASMPASFQFPTDWSDIVGVIGSDLTKIMKDVVTPYTKGEHFTKWNLLEAAKGTIPIAKYWSDLMLAFDKLPGFPGRDGEVWDSKGKFMHKLNPADFIKMFGGATPLQYSIQQTSNRIEARLRERDVAQVASIIEHGVKSRRHITNEFIDGLVEKMAPYAMKGDVILHAIKQAEIPPEMKNVLSARVSRKLDALEEQGRVNAAMHRLGYDYYQFR